MLYNTYNLYLGDMSNEPPRIDVSFRPQELHIEVTVSHARAHLPDLLDDVRAGSTVYLTRYGKRLAALVPADAAERLEQLDDEYWSHRASDAMASSEPPIPWDHVVAELEVADN
jgi:prevent-host-death family protein